MSSDNPQTPPGELGIRRVVESSPIDLASVEYIVSNASIAEAWAKVRSSKGTPGVDKISIEKLPKWGRPKMRIHRGLIVLTWSTRSRNFTLLASLSTS